MVATKSVQKLLKCLTEVKKYLGFGAMGVYISKLPYGGYGGKNSNSKIYVIFLLSTH